MGFLLSYLKNIKISLEQGVIIALTALIGLLVGLLKLQGSRLHAAQVALLEAQLKNREDQDDAAVAAAQAKYEAALKAYREGQ